MSSVGTYLRELRQRRGVSLEEIARTTRVAQRYLESLEAEAFDALPSPVFTRGFIRAYCQALNEPPDEALAAYERREGRPPQPAAARPGAAPRAADAEARGRGAVLVSFVLLVVLGMALFAVALMIHPRDRAERLSATARPEPRAVEPPAQPAPPETPSAPGTPLTRQIPSAGPTPPAPSTPAPGPRAVPPAAAPASPGPPTTPGAPSTPGAPAPAATAARPPDAPVPTPPAVPGVALESLVGTVSSPYRLVARTSETTWIRVRTEDGRSSEENIPAGEIREWVSNRPFVLTIGNAGGVSFELNGRPLPPLGARGAVIQRIVLPPESR